MAIGGRIGYTGAPRVVPFVNVSHQWTDFQQELGGVSRDFQTLEGLIGAEVDLGGIVFGAFGIGVVHDTFDDPARDNTTDLAFSGGIEWNATDLTSVLLTARRTSEATTVDDAASKTATFVDLTVEHELQRNILVGGDLEFRQDVFEGGTNDRTDDRLSAGASVEYLFNRNFSAFASYRYTNRMSTDDTRDFSRNEVFVGLRSQL